MADPVVVVVGEWDCRGGQGWHFEVEKNVMAQCIVVMPDMDFQALKLHIEEEFGVKNSGLEANITFWMPPEMSMLSTNEAPPVCIKSDNGFQTFREARRGRKWLSLFVSFGSPSGVDLNSHPAEGIQDAEMFAAAVPSQTQIQPGGGIEDLNWDYGIIRLRDEPPSSGQDVGERAEFGCGDLFRNMPGVVIKDGGGNAQPKLNQNEAAEAPTGKGKSVMGDNSVTAGQERVFHIPDSDDVYELDFWDAVALGDTAESRKRVARNLEAEFDTDRVVPDIRALSESDSSVAVVPEVGSNSVNVDDFAGSVLVDEVQTEQCGPDVHPSRQTTRRQAEVYGEKGNPIEGLTCHGNCGRDIAGIAAVSIPAEGVGRGQNSSDFPTPVGGSISGENDEASVSETPMSGVPLGLGVQSTLENIYEEIREAGLIPTKDAPSVFDDGYVLTGQAAPIDFDAADDAIYIGRNFADKDEMATIIAIHAIKRLFTFKIAKRDRDRLILECVDPECKWRVFAHTISPNSENVEIRTARLNHTCSVQTRARYEKKATAKVIAEVIKKKYANGRTGPRAIEIPGIVLDELRVSITYMKAWYAKEKAVENARGSEEESYKLLRAYLYVMAKANPGTVYDIETRLGSNGEKRFKYLFFALGASISGLPYLRKVVIIDGTTIKAKYQGCMLTASMQDGNFKVFPLAFGVVDGENEDSWTWFLTQLTKIIPDAPYIMFVSDRHTSIYPALRAVYPLAQHGSCSVHLYRNVKYRYKGLGMGYLVSQAARAYSVSEFRYWFGEVERRSVGCANYLREIGLSHWTQAYCLGMRYNISSTNTAESLNSAMAKALQYPIVTMVEAIRMMLMQWFCWRREHARQLSTVLTDKVEELVMKHLEESSSMAVVRASDWIYQVNAVNGDCYTVNLEKRSCTCRLFEKLCLPCSHALAAARACGLPIWRMAEPVYTADFLRKVYEVVIMPVPNVNDEDIPAEENERDLTNPQTGRGIGRPRKRRIPSQGEGPSKSMRIGQNRCSRCLEKGHNKATCKNPLP